MVATTLPAAVLTIFTSAGDTPSAVESRDSNAAESNVETSPWIVSFFSCVSGGATRAAGVSSPQLGLGAGSLRAYYTQTTCTGTTHTHTPTVPLPPLRCRCCCPRSLPCRYLHLRILHMCVFTYMWVNIWQMFLILLQQQYVIANRNTTYSQ